MGNMTEKDFRKAMGIPADDDGEGPFDERLYRVWMHIEYLQNTVNRQSFQISELTDAIVRQFVKAQLYTPPPPRDYDE